MDVQTMLGMMCREILSDVDVKAIVKNRGFPSGAATSRAVFATFYLSDAGVAKALASLTRPEVILLHLLASTDMEVDVSAFGRLYGAASHGWGTPTFTQAYRDVYKQVQTQLLRKGVLLIGQVPNPDNAYAKLETWRFRLPSQFAALLPPLFPAPARLPGEGEVNRPVLRDKVLEIGGATQAVPPGKRRPWQWSVTAGHLWLGEHPFRAEDLQAWRLARWEAELEATHKPSVSKDAARQPMPVSAGSSPAVVSLMQACTYAFAQLKAGEWITPADLAPVLRIFCDIESPDAAAACDTGWRWGYLAREQASDKPCYRPVASLAAPEADAGDPAGYLHVDGAGGVDVDLGSVPYATLAHIARISQLRVSTRVLNASPDRIEIGRTFPETREHPLTKWLWAHAPAYRAALEAVEAGWGKHLLHNGLLLAQIGDVGLRIQIERALPDEDLVVLDDHYIAFPADLLPAIEKVVRKGGFVIKTVEESEGRHDA